MKSCEDTESSFCKYLSRLAINQTGNKWNIFHANNSYTQTSGLLKFQKWNWNFMSMIWSCLKMRIRH